MDFLNKEKLTHIIIFIFILLSLTYLYNMNSNTKETTKTITENFMILTEDQDIGANKVMIKNLTQVEFEAGGNNNGTVNFPNPDMDWPVSLQDIFDTKLDNSGVIGTFTPGNTPLQGIVLSDKAGKTLVKIGDAIPFGPATDATTITHNAIQFGGTNKTSAAIDTFSAQISIDVHQAGSLCLVGMNKPGGGGRNIDMWVDSGRLKIRGPVTITDALTVSGALNLSSRLTVSAGGLGITAGGLTVTAGGLTVSAGGLTVSAGTAIFSGGTSTTTLAASGTLTVSGETTVTNINFNNVLRGVGDANIHLVGGGETYIMARGNVRIYKETGAAHWKNPSGNLIVENNLTVSGTTTLTGRVTGNTSFSNDVSVYGNIWMASTNINTQNGAINAGNGTISTTGSMACSGLSASNGLVVSAGGAQITGETKCWNALVVHGPIWMAGTNINTQAGIIDTGGGNILCHAGKINVNYVETNRIETGILNVSGTITGNFLGYGQTWHAYNIVSERIVNTPYPNNTSRPIFLAISVITDGGFFDMYVDNVNVGRAGEWGDSKDWSTMYAIVPINSNYLVKAAGSYAIEYWSELRNPR